MTDVAKSRSYAYHLMRREYDRAGGRWRTLEILAYDARGNLLYKAPAEALGGGWESPAPESATETMMRDACKRPREVY